MEYYDQSIKNDRHMAIHLIVPVAEFAAETNGSYKAKRLQNTSVP